MVESLYLGTAIMGFSISMQVASGFAWLADQVDMTGFRNSVVFLGGNSGWLIFPPLPASSSSLVPAVSASISSALVQNSFLKKL